MSLMKKTVVLSLGGSVIVPDNVDAKFLGYFKKTIEKLIRKNFKFVIYSYFGLNQIGMISRYF